jgi:hypothetical protein
MNENSTFQDLLPAVQAVIGYGERNVNSDRVKRAVKMGKRRVVCRVNTPDKTPAMYIHYIFPKKGILTRPFVIVDGAEGEAFVTASKDPDTGKFFLTVIHSHAINRYIERRQFHGTLAEAQQRIIDGIAVNTSAEDKLNETGYLYFDGGTFLCNFKNGVQHIRTFVMNRQLYPAQRMKSLTSEKETAQLKREVGYKEPPKH